MTQKRSASLSPPTDSICAQSSSNKTLLVSVAPLTSPTTPPPPVPRTRVPAPPSSAVRPAGCRHSPPSCSLKPELCTEAFLHPMHNCCEWHDSSSSLPLARPQPQHFHLWPHRNPSYKSRANPPVTLQEQPPCHHRFSAAMAPPPQPATPGPTSATFSGSTAKYHVRPAFPRSDNPLTRTPT